MRNKTEVQIDFPEPCDGAELNRLVASSPPLDTNSVYCNLLQCTHFYETSICAKYDGELVGFVSGYRIPKRANTLFVWQVVVAESVRGQGLASRMLAELLNRPACSAVDYVETTISPSNKASQTLFKKLAHTLAAPISLSMGFDVEEHFEGQHESEELWRIGPISKIQTRLLI